MEATQVETRQWKYQVDRPLTVISSVLYQLEEGSWLLSETAEVLLWPIFLQSLIWRLFTYNGRFFFFIYT